MSTTHVDHDGLVTSAMVDQYRTEGYFIIERALDGDDLDVLRRGAQVAMDAVDRDLDAEGVEQQGLNRRGKRYFPTMVFQQQPALRRVLLGDTLAGICRATLGDEAYLFWEQYAIKGADPDSSFAWHQDSGYVHEDHTPYLTCWIALDDVDESNGTVYLLPYSRSGIRSYVKHVKEDGSDEATCYFGQDPGVAVTVPAGSIVCFSSVVIHRSGPNLTDRLRRAYIAQYSSDVITDPSGTRPWGLAEPFLRGGRRTASLT